MHSEAEHNKRFDEILEREGFILPSSTELDQQYHAVVVSGQLVTVWTLPLIGDRSLAAGRLSAEPTPGADPAKNELVECAPRLQQGIEAAQICVINGLSIIRNNVASLSQVRAATALTLFINSAADFQDLDQVSEAATTLISVFFPLSPNFHMEVLGSEYLPLNSSVALSVTFEVEGVVL